MRKSSPGWGSDVELTNDLFDLAVKSRHEAERVVVPPGRAEEFDWISHLLDVIDAEWQLAPGTETQVMAAFTKRVREQLGETWAELRAVATLGDLIATRGAELPSFSELTIRLLKADATPISQLTDPSSGILAVVRAMRDAGVPKTFIADFLRWLRRVLNDTTAAPGQSGAYVVRAA
jgi:hypothetical protein